MRLCLFHNKGSARDPLNLPEKAGPIVTLSEKLYVPVKEHPEVSTRALSQETLSSGFPTRSNANRAVHLPQKMARGLKFRIKEVEEGLNYLCRENKGADQLCGFAVDLRNCFCIRKNGVSLDSVQIYTCNFTFIFITENLFTGTLNTKQTKILIFINFWEPEKFAVIPLKFELRYFSIG